MRPPRLPEMLDALKAHDTAEEARRKGSDEWRGEQLKRIQDRIKAGETTGDVADDFVTCCCHGFSQAQRVNTLKKLRGVQSAIASHPGQAALIVVTKTETFGHGGCFGGPPTHEKRSYLLGKLTGDRIVLDTAHASWALPTTQYATWDRNGPTWKHDGPMAADTSEMLEWYGLGNHHGHDTNVAVIIGNKEVDFEFAAHFEHAALARLTSSVDLEMSLFPVCGDLLGNTK